LTTITDPKIEVKNLNVFYGDFQALYDVSLLIQKNKVTSLIGPTHCGKTTFLRVLNRLTDLKENSHHTGTVLIDNDDIYSKKDDAALLRKKVGMVFQNSNLFPKSIYENIAYGPKIHGIKNTADLDEIVEKSLTKAEVWNDLKDKLDQDALSLTKSIQKHLSIARALAVDPEIILMDEPAFNLDPNSTSQIEALINKLKTSMTIIMVTHNMQQAARVSDYTAFFYEGRLIEYDDTDAVFTRPAEKLTEDYITGRLQ